MLISCFYINDANLSHVYSIAKNMMFRPFTAELVPHINLMVYILIVGSINTCTWRKKISSFTIYFKATCSAYEVAEAEVFLDPQTPANRPPPAALLLLIMSAECPGASHNLSRRTLASLSHFLVRRR